MIVKQIVLSLLLLFIVFFALRVIWGLLDFLFRKNESAMYVPSFNRHIRLMKDQLKIISGKKLVDLGCGDGKAMRFFTEAFGLQCDGYELQRFPYRYGRFCNFALGFPTINLYKKNFLQVDIGRYDYIYVYLLPHQMADIESRIFKNIAPHAIVISNSFQFVEHKPYEVIKDRKGKASIFLYRKNG